MVNKGSAVSELISQSREADSAIEVITKGNLECFDGTEDLREEMKGLSGTETFKIPGFELLLDS